MSPVRAPDPEAQRERLHGAARALETLVLKQLVNATKVFTGGEGAGSAIRADMFADALADAMVKGGGIGLARQIEQSLGSGPPPRVAPRPLTPALSLGGGEREDLPSPASLLPAAPRRPLALPATGGEGGGLGRITSPFGLRQDPFDGHLTRHEGVDLAGDEGAEIHAAGGGVVKRSGDLGGYGNAVEIDHGNGLTTLYAHASDLLVRDGDRVTPGQAIARVGHSGRATGPHLHFEVRLGGRPVDPRSMLPRPEEPLLGAPSDLRPPAAAPRALRIYGVRAEEEIKSGS
jgi:murein DD-endopeptidase MepM/ murein hydrolase activator NlpD